MQMHQSRRNAQSSCEYLNVMQNSLYIWAVMAWHFQDRNNRIYRPVVNIPGVCSSSYHCGMHTFNSIFFVNSIQSPAKPRCVAAHNPCVIFAQRFIVVELRNKTCANYFVLFTALEYCLYFFGLVVLVKVFLANFFGGCVNNNIRFLQQIV